jgi:hypothetical protein
MKALLLQGPSPKDCTLGIRLWQEYGHTHSDHRRVCVQTQDSMHSLPSVLHLEAGQLLPSLSSPPPFFPDIT